ncbi:MAG: aspartate aminotransferase family protein [Candidatus Binatia bacterium]|nr:MAG: aspartate aminotransferase family protein [Candidatus Binatia bacterium]
MSRLREDFLRYVCQTSDSPMGLVVARAEGSRVWDESGNCYLDLLSGIGVANVGHTNPEVVAAVERQAKRYLHVMVYGEMVLEPQVELARRLARRAPGELSVTYFANSGTEAIEGALKTARKYTGRKTFVAFEGSFHGDTLGSLSVGGNPLYRKPFEPLLPEVRFLPFDDTEALESIDEDVAAVVLELVQAEAGVRIPRPEFVSRLSRRCRETGALLVVDEVVTGFGRTGRLFACEHWGVEPDLLVLAKALGGGLPLGAFVGRPEPMRTLSHDPPLAHVTTFGGHPLSCAAALAAWDFLDRENLLARSEELGRRFFSALRPLEGEKLREVRGLGCLLGLEFADERLVRRFVETCRELGVLVGWTLHRDTVVRLAPPLVLTDDEFEEAVDKLAEALRRS